jgi:dTDP-4-dehydrorhamnose reductase
LPKRTLITGGSGFLAVNWALSERDNSDVWLLLNKQKINIARATETNVDLLSKENFLFLVNKIKPDLIVHTAAITDVNYCEKFPNEAIMANVDLANVVSFVSNAVSVPLIHISTDHLFSGTTSYVDENYPVSPLNSYAYTKALSEDIVLKNNPEALILRTNFFGWGPPYRGSFSDWIINNLRSSKSITLFDNVFFTPIYVNELVKIALCLHLAGKAGVYNVSSTNRLSKFDFGILLANQFELDLSLIKKGQYDVLGKVQRPLDMSLDNKKLLDCGIIKTMDIRKSIKTLFKEEYISQELESIVCDV